MTYILIILYHISQSVKIISQSFIYASVYFLQGNASKKASDDFLSEAAYMGQFDDPNVIALEGVVVRGSCFDFTCMLSLDGSLTGINCHILLNCDVKLWPQ